MIKWLLFLKKLVLTLAEANPILEAKGSSPMVQADKMFKVFSRPQIDLEDFLKFEKVTNYVI